MGRGRRWARPGIEAPDTDTPVPPRSRRRSSPTRPWSARCKRVCARSDEETWRKVESCLTPTRSQLEQMLEQMQSPARTGRRA